MVQEAFVADPYWFRVSVLRQRNVIRRASRAEHFSAVPTVMSPLHHGEIRTATHAFRRLHVRYPDRWSLYFLRRISPLTVRRYGSVFRSISRLFPRIIRVFSFVTVLVLIVVQVKVNVGIEEGLLC